MADADLRVQPMAADKSLGELFSELGEELSALVRTEVQLAKTEAKEEVTKAGKAGGMFAGAGIEAHFMLLFASVALGWLLQEVMHVALAFLIVAVLHGLVAFVLYTRARREMAALKPMPETVASVKENVA